MTCASHPITKDEGPTMAFHKLVRPLAVGISLLFAGVAVADDVVKPNTLTAKEITDGWILLFDGETTFGWKIDGDANVKDGSLVIGGSAKTIATLVPRLSEYDLRLEANGTGTLTFAYDGGSAGLGLTSQPTLIGYTVRIGKTTTESNLSTNPEGVLTRTGTVETPRPAEVRIEVAAGQTVTVRNAKAKPHGLRAFFNGKDLTGWKKFTGNPKQSRSEFSVTPAGELALKNGPGDLQSEKEFDDFVLQLECKTNGKGLNSGIFFRCLPGQYQQGYEAQIQNAYKDNDRTKPVDFGTGAIYRRVPARKVVSNDHEWFTMTVLALGPHIATWVNGCPVVNWTDERKPADNARNGLYTRKGPISIQGHDPTTDLLFRNIRIADLKAN
jgi:hypothetical protein